MTKKQYQHFCIKFLSDNGVLVSFMKNVQDAENVGTPGVPGTLYGLIAYCNKPRRRFDLITLGFIWNKSPEGNQFWRDISYKFITEYKTL